MSSCSGGANGGAIARPGGPTRALKKAPDPAETVDRMTVSTITTLDEWAAHPIGKAARLAIAVLGLASAILVLMVATMNTHAAWLLVLLGVTLAATSIRAAQRPTLIRLTSLLAVMIAIPYLGQTL